MTLNFESDINPIKKNIIQASVKNNFFSKFKKKIIDKKKIKPDKGTFFLVLSNIL